MIPPKIFYFDNDYLEDNELNQESVRKMKEERHFREIKKEEEKLLQERKEKEELAQFMKRMEEKGMRQKIESLGDACINCLNQI